MNLRDGRLKTGYDRAAGCNHFPVGQARCDGRTTRTSDRPSHATSFPISDPVLHSDGERNWWNGLYGMNKLGMEDLVQLGRAWAYAPEIVVEGEFESQGYDRSERVYQIKGKGKREKEKGKRETLSLKVKGTKDSPIWNPAFYVKGWNGEAPEVWVDGALYGKAKLGLKYELEGTDLVVYLPIKRTGEVIIELKTK